MKRMQPVWMSLLGFLVLVGCGDADSDLHPSLRTLIQIEPGTDDGVLLDVAAVDSAWIEGDSVKVTVRYSGGCEEHDFQLLAPDAFEPGAPSRPLHDPDHYPWLPVYLRHDAKGDACRAVIQETRSFAVRPASDLYRTVSGGTDGFFTLRIHTLAAPGSVVSVSVLAHSGAGESPREDREAERVATFLTGALTADDARYDRVKSDLAAIRGEYGDAKTALGRPLGEIGFVLPWVPRELVLNFDEATHDSILAVQYPYWNRLHQALGLTAADPHRRFFVLEFRPELFVCSLAEAHRDLPGLDHPPHPNFLAGDWPGIFPRITGNGMSYVFREAWGDCLAGCTRSEYWYFESTGTGIVFHGRYDPLTDGPVPPWWSEADQNLIFYNNRCGG